jgi:hypothetical protein
LKSQFEVSSKIKVVSSCSFELEVLVFDEATSFWVNLLTGNCVDESVELVVNTLTEGRAREGLGSHFLFLFKINFILNNILVCNINTSCLHEVVDSVLGKRLSVVVDASYDLAVWELSEAIVVVPQAFELVEFPIILRQIMGLFRQSFPLFLFFEVFLIRCNISELG